MDYLTPTHQEILDVLNQTGVAVILNNHKICESRKYDGMVLTKKDVNNHSGRTQLVLCEDVVQQNHPDWQGEMNRTIAHESVHVAQICKVPSGYFYPLGFKNDIEKEAFAIQDQPREVLRILKKYCL
jgi:hypothetical protein